jgi:hypothetical protein
MNKYRSANPFSVQTPEEISAVDVKQLFVDVFSDFFNIEKSSHTFLHGHRGSGKSMMFRAMEPDCQMLARNMPLRELPYYAVYVPIKLTDLNLVEFNRLGENEFADFVLNEHSMTIFMAAKVVSSLLKIVYEDYDMDEAVNGAVLAFYHDSFVKLLKRGGWVVPENTPETPSKTSDHFRKMQESLDEIYAQTSGYLRRVSFSKEAIPYVGVLVGYLDFLLPMIKDLKRLPFMPSGPVFLMVDDADNLSRSQTLILNSWVSYRTTADVSLKISTQMNYKTYRTANGQRIDAPHDYSDVNIQAVYTSDKDKYPKRVKEIVKRRLDMLQISATPEQFFPEDEEQEAKIRELYEEIKNQWPDSGKGYRATDDAYRYARPEYMKSLLGKSKNFSTYKYAGFDQLVHISSGVIRYFLETASLMYGEQRASGTDLIEAIPPAIQNKVIREWSDAAMFSEFEKIVRDEESETGSKDPAESLGKLQKLRNLINALGGLFHELLVSALAERRVFSFALSDAPSNELKEILDLGVRYGYFHESTIGNKEGTGRTKLYILSRRLAPHFKLDPTGFSGYKFMTNMALIEAMHKPGSLLRRAKKAGLENDLSDAQGDLFTDG